MLTTKTHTNPHLVWPHIFSSAHFCQNWRGGGGGRCRMLERERVAFFGAIRAIAISGWRQPAIFASPRPATFYFFCHTYDRKSWKNPLNSLSLINLWASLRATTIKMALHFLMCACTYVGGDTSFYPGFFSYLCGSAGDHLSESREGRNSRERGDFLCGEWFVALDTF